MSLEENGSPGRNDIRVIVNGNGLLRIRCSAHPSSSLVDMQVADGSILTLVSGNVEMQTNAMLGASDLGGSFTGKGLLRGSGTYTKRSGALNPAGDEPFLRPVLQKGHPIQGFIRG